MRSQSDLREQEYQAVWQTAGLLDCKRRGKVRVNGPDRIDFLHAMVSNDVQGLDNLKGCYATFLTSTGRLIAAFCVYRFQDHVLLDVEDDRLSTLQKTLRGFIIMDDVELVDVTSQWKHISVQGPKSREILEDFFKQSLPTRRLEVKSFEHEGTHGWVIRKGTLHDEGFELLLSTGRAATIIRQLESPPWQLTRIGSDIQDLLRLERGLARFGVDMTEQHSPLEARLDQAISLDKGCYVGQEVISKATFVGRVPRLLCRLQYQGQELPAAGDQLQDEQGSRVGTVTSSALSPRFGPIALGYVRRRSANSGTRLVSTHSGRRLTAVVVEAPTALKMPRNE